MAGEGRSSTGRRAAPGRRADRPWRPPHRVTSSLAALLVAACACAGVLLAGPVARALPGAGDLVRTDAASSTLLADAGDARADAVQALLDGRATALLARDRDGWLAGVGPAAAGASGATGTGVATEESAGAAPAGASVLAASGDDYAARQAAVFDDIAEVPLEEWRWEYAGEGGAPATSRAGELEGAAWVARVVLVYRLEGAAEVRREQHLTVAPDGGGGWRLVDDRDGPTAVDLWDLGPVHVARGERSLVIGTGDVAAYPAVVDEAAARVDDVWGQRWPRTTVVEVPRSQAELARLLGRDGEAGLSQIAAVTTGETSAGEATTTGDRVVVNPDGFARLAALGRLVVLTHELTHVATRATTTSDVPIWLAEGFADWVGYRGTGLSRQTVASPLLAAVRGGDVPTALPDAEDFDPVEGDVSAAYAGSWLIIDMLVREHGETAVVDLYREVAGVDAAAGAPDAVADPPVTDPATPDPATPDPATPPTASGTASATPGATGATGGATTTPGATTPGATTPGTAAPGTTGSGPAGGGGAAAGGDAQDARVDAALRAQVGTDLADLRTDWQRYLVTVAG